MSGSMPLTMLLSYLHLSILQHTPWKLQFQKCKAHQMLCYNPNDNDSSSDFVNAAHVYAGDNGGHPSECGERGAPIQCFCRWKN